MLKMKNKRKRTENPDGSMSLSGHLKELRNRIVVVLLVLIVGIVVCFAYAEPLVRVLTAMGDQYNYRFIYLKPQELLMVYFTISLIGGAVLAFPVLGYEVYGFASPGLKKTEQTFMILALVFGVICFGIGVYFAYKIMLPFMLRFLISFSATISIDAAISIQEYVSFIMLIFVIFGIIFELPVISVLLTSLGIVRPEWLVKARKIMIVMIFVLAAVITPPDIVSQIMVAIPIIVLYEVSIGLSKFVYRFKKKKVEDEETEEE